MIKMARRGFLKAMSVTPLVAKQAAEESAMALAHMEPKLGITKVADELDDTYWDGLEPASERVRSPGRADYLKALRTPLGRDIVRSKLYEEEQHIYAIDHDLASKRSFSLAAKIAYQRQRNVQAKMREIEEESAFKRGSKLIFQLLGESPFAEKKKPRR